MKNATTPGQQVLFEKIKNYLNLLNIPFRIEVEGGDYLFYCLADSGEQFTIDVCGEYIEFYSDKTHNSINYVIGSFIEDILLEIKKYKSMI